MAEVTYERVEKDYGPLPVVHDFSLAVADGEFLVVVGPSGCGKTSILRMTAGLETITRGVLRIGPRVVNELAPRDRDVAMVFQSYALYPHMTVYDNMAFGLKLRHVARAEIDRRVRAAAEVLGLTHHIASKPRQLSGGERQRVALGRAIVREPQVFLLDEPLSNLDAKLRAQTRVELLRLHRELGTTMIYVTHDQLEAMTMGDRIAVVRGGRLQQADSPDEVYRHPVNQFVAGFVGSPAMNFLEVEVGPEAEPTLRGPGIELAVPADHPARGRLQRGQALTAGVRPEHLHLAPAGPGEAAPLRLQGLVDVVEPLGAETFLHCRVGAATVVVRLPGLRAALPRAGDPVSLAVEPDALCLFDRETQATL